MLAKTSRPNSRLWALSILIVLAATGLMTGGTFAAPSEGLPVVHGVGEAQEQSSGQANGFGQPDLARSAQGSQFPSKRFPVGGAMLPNSSSFPLATPSSTPNSTPDPCSPMWSIVSSPNVGTSYNYLRGVAAVSASDVWAVGEYYNGSIEQTLIEHWNGTAWSVVASPNVGTSNNALIGVAAVSASDVWAVGDYNDYPTGTRETTLIEHWNGTSWSIVPSPNIGTSDNYLNGVAVVSANDVWAVGYYGYDTWHPIIEHWNGSSWSVTSSPNVGTYGSQLYGVAVVSANDVWAVGVSYYGPVNGPSQPLIEHWNGTAWSVVSGPGSNALIGVAAVSASDVWAVGFYYNGSIEQTLIEHWNGTAWSVVPSPNVGASGGRLFRIAAQSTNSIWAVGWRGGSPWNGSTSQTLVEQWDGTSWSVVPSPNIGTSYNLFYDVAAVSANDVWAVGFYNNGSVNQTLLEHHTSSTLSSPCPTNTSTPTNTPTPGRSPIILVHGFNGGSYKPELVCDPNGSGSEVTQFFPQNQRNTATDGWGRIPDWLYDAGYDVWVAQLKTGLTQGTASLEDNGRCLVKQIARVYDRTSHRPITLIAHSMGGPVSRAALRDSTTAHEVKALYTIQSPHAGLSPATIASWSRLVPGLLLLTISGCEWQAGGCDMSATLMEDFNKDHPNRSGISYGFIGGNHNPFLTYPGVIWRPQDGLVSSRSAIGQKENGTFKPPNWASNPTPVSFWVNEVHDGFIKGINFLDHNAYSPFECRPEIDGTQCQPNQPSRSYICIAYLLQRHPNGPPPPSVCVTQTTAQNSVGAGSSLTASTASDPTGLLEPASGHISTGQYYSHTLILDAPDTAAFSLSWLTGTLAFTLTQPDGTIIDPPYAASHSDIVSYGDSIGSDGPPIASYYFTSTNQVGVWMLNVQGVSVPVSETNYVGLVSVESTRTLTVATDKNQYDVGETALISATLQSSGTGLTGANVAADITQSDGVTETLPLVDRGGGAYNANYVIPNKAGILAIAVRTDGTDNGTPYTRHSDALVAIAPQDARVTGPHLYQAVNSNNDQLYEALAFTTTVTATNATTYTMYADLTANDQIAAHASAYLHLTPGTQTVTLQFDGNEIRASQLDGPYTITHVSLVNVDLGITAQSLEDVLTTQAYNWQDFGGCYTLTTQTSPSNGGVIIVGPSPNCGGGTAYSVDTAVTLTATTNSGYDFIDWSGDITGTTSVITTTLDADKIAQANFVELPPTNPPTITPTRTITYTPTKSLTPSNTPTPYPGDAYAHLYPDMPIMVNVGTQFNLDLLVNSGSYSILSQSSYMTFTSSILQNVNAGQVGCVLTNTVTGDYTTLTSGFQNEVCNGPNPCNFSETTNPGSIGYISAASSNISGDFHVARLAFCATTPGDAVIHWQFSPPDPANRSSEIRDSANNLWSNPTLYTDYHVQVIPYSGIVGHVAWQGRPAQPSVEQQMPISLTLSPVGGGAATEFDTIWTGSGGTFAVPSAGLAPGSYTWRAKGLTYLAVTGTLTLTGASTTNVEMGTLLAGDCDNNNAVGLSDFNILKSTFGKVKWQDGYDASAEFDGNNTIGLGDFTLLKSNFGSLGAHTRPLSP